LLTVEGTKSPEGHPDDRMESELRKRAEFYARLASIAKLEDLSLSAGLKLQEEMERIGFPWLKKLSSVRERLAKANRSLTAAEIQEEELRRFRTTFSHVAFHDIHRYSRDLINGLLDNGEFDLTFYRPLSRTTVRLDKKTDRITQEIKAPDPQDEMILDLLDLLRQPSFPFRRCLACKIVFVPVKSQRYCSPTCSYKGTEQARKKSKANYMRHYMRQKRRKHSATV
jgi:hypothetical protein